MTAEPTVPPPAAPDIPPDFARFAEPQRAYLTAYARTRNVSLAAKSAGVTRDTVHSWRKRAPGFAAAEQIADQMANDYLFHSAWLQGVVGTDEPVFRDGAQVGVVRRRRADLTKLLMEQASKPSRYAGLSAAEWKAKKERDRRRARETRLAVLRRRFVHHYVAGEPGTAGKAGPAAMAAGMGKTPAGANLQGHMMLRDPVTLEMIRRALEAMDATEQRIITELGRVAFATIHDLDLAIKAVETDTVEALPDHVAAVISEVKRRRRYDEAGNCTEELEVKRHDKVTALALLAKIRRMLAVRLEHTGKDGGPIEGRVTFYLPASPRSVTPALSEAAPVIIDVPPPRPPLTSHGSNGTGGTNGAGHP